RIAVDARRDRREGDRGETVLVRKLKRAAVAVGKELRLAVQTAAPHGADGMDHITRRQAVAAGDLGIARRAALECAALAEEIGTRFAVNGAIDTAAAKQRCICGIDDRI